MEHKIKYLYKNPPVSEAELILFEKKLSLNLPASYRSLLLCANGMHLYFNSFFAEKRYQFQISQFFSLNEVIDFLPDILPKNIPINEKNIITIGECGGPHGLCIDLPSGSVSIRDAFGGSMFEVEKSFDIFLDNIVYSEETIQFGVFPYDTEAKWLNFSAIVDI